MQKRRYLDLALGSLWIVMGLLCKVLGLVPRHEEIVAEILGSTYASQLTIAIGLGETFLGIWIAAGYMRKISASLQIVLVIAMNILEFKFAIENLMWGPLNIIFAAIFCLFVYWNGFMIPDRSNAK